MPDGIEVISRGILLRGSQILLCRNERAGYFYLPGGHVEMGESAAEACAREFLEESGLKVRIGGCALVCEHRFAQVKRERHELNLVFHVELAEPKNIALESVTSRESGISFAWAKLETLPSIDLRPRAIGAWLVSGSGASVTDRPDWLSVHE